ncbi:hypothetical protein BRADI_3g29504v3 [Brachypodium distachyon]|uniref:Uncharacterized protein n=2 Tax=Brachypodium distachyon TaxID=15368 RepID=A0A0Q3IA98_BRADI|nr:hypothetical protein BRADI_3g29504v3 [Brachypodium distachyon]
MGPRRRHRKTRRSSPIWVQCSGAVGLFSGLPSQSGRRAAPSAAPASSDVRLGRVCEWPVFFLFFLKFY